MRQTAKIVAVTGILAATFAFAANAADSGPNRTPPLSGIVEIGQPPMPSGLESGRGYPSPDTIGTNVRCNSDQGGAMQNETTISVSPVDPDILVGGANDYRNGEVDAGYYYSHDGGLTWSDGTLGNLGIHAAQGDPCMAVDADGDFFYGYIDFDRGSPDNGIFVAKTTDGGVTWTGPYEVIDHTGDPDAPFEDKCYIAADRTDSQYRNNVYVTWTTVPRFVIVLSRSTDGGFTWSEPNDVSFGGSQGSCPTVGPNGEVYVAWADYGWPNSIKFNKSTNAGQTFGTVRQIAEVDFLPSPLPPTDFRVNSFPSLDADISGGPHTGNLYVCYADYSTGDADILFTRSTDGGDTWMPPRRINDDEPYNGKDQFFPWLSVDNLGNVDVMWYDRRNDPENRKFDVYCARSTNGGMTFSRNERVTDEISDPGNTGFIGDYNAIANFDGVAHPLWTDMRVNDENMYTARCYAGEFPDLALSCEATADVLCPGTHFLFSLTVENNTGGSVDVDALLTGYAGADCVPGSEIAYIPRTRTFANGVNTYYYYYKLPDWVEPGTYSASVSFGYGEEYYTCCMGSITILDCGPWE